MNKMELEALPIVSTAEAASKLNLKILIEKPTKWHKDRTLKKRT